MWESRDRFLTGAAILYGAGLALHTADHIRRGAAVLTPEVKWVGAITTIVGAVTVLLVFARHPRAPLVAALTGIPNAIGIAAVHLLPHWSALSDAFPGATGTGVTAYSWTVVPIEIVGAVLLGIAGARLLRLHRQAEKVSSGG